MSPKTFEGTGETIEEAIDAAHMQIPIPPGSDITVSRVVDWGMQYGGFIPQRTFWVIVEEDPNGTHPLKTADEASSADRPVPFGDPARARRAIEQFDGPHLSSPSRGTRLLLPVGRTSRHLTSRLGNQILFSRGLGCHKERGEWNAV